MAHIVFVTQLLDDEDPVLGFTIGWIRALARHARVTVIANEVRGRLQHLGVDVMSLGKEQGAARLARGLRFQRALARVIRRHRPQALLAHMCPIYLNLAAPLARVAGVRLLLWYAHPSRRSALLVAERLADVIFTSFPGTYPGRSRKVRVIGQGIDLELFRFRPRPPRSDLLRLVSIGRTSPLKGYRTAIEAIGIARRHGIPVRLSIVGPSTTREERRYRQELEGLVRALGLHEFVQLIGGIPRAAVAAVLHEADALVNTMVTGSGDKVVLEALATGRPVLASNPVFSDLLGRLPVRLCFREGDPHDLAGRIEELAALPHGVWLSTVEELRRRVEHQHGLDKWAQRVVSFAGGGSLAE